LEGKPSDRIFEMRRGLGRSQTLRSVRGTGIWIHDDRNQPIGWLVILEDVTDASRLEKLAAWQEVARRVAHEIKNPLTPIQISADRLVRRLLPSLDAESQEREIFQECVGQIQKQVKVIRDLVREFSEFAKLPEPKLAPLSLKQVLSDFLRDYRFMHPEYSFSFEDLRLNAEDGAVVSADPEYIRRLFTNLADNALQSMAEAKTSAPRLKVTLEEPPKGLLRVVIEDNGPGIPETMRERIFDPYVTSKSSGIGLGLAIVRRIAIEHMGRVRCEAAEGGRFVLELPQLSLENQAQHEDSNPHR
jgi:two-component system, NtrC family, nitrogen regulation sensor histidine kinase NtrY